MDLHGCFLQKAEVSGLTLTPATSMPILQLSQGEEEEEEDVPPPPEK